MPEALREALIAIGIFIGSVAAALLVLSIISIWAIAQCHYIPKKKRRKDK